MKEILSKKVEGMYKGWQAYFALSFKPSIQYAVFEQFKTFILSGRSELSALEAFLGGALGRSVATIITFPYTRAKILKQSRKRSVKHAGRMHALDEQLTRCLVACMCRVAGQCVLIV